MTAQTTENYFLSNFKHFSLNFYNFSIFFYNYSLVEKLILKSLVIKLKLFFILF